MAARMLFKSKPAFFLATHPITLRTCLHLRDLFNGCLQLTKTGKFDFKDVPLVRLLFSLEKGCFGIDSDAVRRHIDLGCGYRELDPKHRPDDSRIGFVLVTKFKHQYDY